MTCFQGKCFMAAKATVTAGLRWAPEMWPVEKIMMDTVRPVATATIVRVGASCVFGFNIAMAVAANISIKVPRNSAPTWLIYPQSSLY